MKTIIIWLFKQIAKRYKIGAITQHYHFEIRDMYFYDDELIIVLKNKQQMFINS